MERTMTDIEMKRVVISLAHNMTTWMDTVLPKGKCTLGEVYMIYGWAFFLAMKSATLFAGIISKEE